MTAAYDPADPLPDIDLQLQRCIFASYFVFSNLF